MYSFECILHADSKYANAMDVPRAKKKPWYLSMSMSLSSTTKNSFTACQSDVRFRRYSNLKPCLFSLFYIVFRPKEGSIFSFVFYCFFDSLGWFFIKKMCFCFWYNFFLETLTASRSTGIVESCMANIYTKFQHNSMIAWTWKN